MPTGEFIAITVFSVSFCAALIFLAVIKPPSRPLKTIKSCDGGDAGWVYSGDSDHSSHASGHADCGHSDGGGDGGGGCH